MRKLTVAVALLSLALWGVVSVASSAPAPKKRGPAPRTKAAARVKKPAAKAKAITWHSYDEGLQLARRQKKVVLVDVMAEWCHWCKKMDSEVYTDKSIIALGDRVVFIRVDMDKRSDLAGKYRVDSVPTTILLRDGKEITRIVGYENAPKFGAHVRQALVQPVPK